MVSTPEPTPMTEVSSSMALEKDLITTNWRVSPVEIVELDIVENFLSFDNCEVRF